MEGQETRLNKKGIKWILWIGSWIEIVRTDEEGTAKEGRSDSRDGLN